MGITTYPNLLIATPYINSSKKYITAQVFSVLLILFLTPLMSLYKGHDTDRGESRNILSKS